MKIAIGGDHAGFEYKEVLIEMLKTDGHEVKDFGPYNLDSVDYFYEIFLFIQLLS